jgi:hypothetical protein
MGVHQVCEDGGAAFCDGFVDFRGTEASHGTCNAFCSGQGLACSKAWEDDEGPNTIVGKAPRLDDARE